MGLLDSILEIFRKNKSKRIVPPEYVPIVPAEINCEEPDEASLKFLAQIDKIHNDNISSFDYKKLQLTDNAALSCIERSFLKYICGRTVQNTNIAAYWTHEYKISYALLMSKFFNRGLLITGFDVNHFTVNMLKDLLRLRGLPVTGKKADLIIRLGGATNLSIQEAAAVQVEECYIATKRGRAIIAVTPDSITKDPDFEDEMLALIQNHQLDTAYAKIMQWKSAHPPSPGVNINWQSHKLSNVQRQDYEKVLAESSDITFGSCTVLSQMFGSGQIIPLLKRLGKYTPPAPSKIIFSKEDILQDEQNFLAHWENALRKNNLTVEVKQRRAGRRFLWQGCQIGEIGFQQEGHWMQWVEDAYTIDFETAWQKDEDDQERYFRDASGKVLNAKNMTLQECIDKIPHWIQYIHVLAENKQLRNK